LAKSLIRGEESFFVEIMGRKTRSCDEPLSVLFQQSKADASGRITPGQANRPKEAVGECDIGILLDQVPQPVQIYVLAGDHGVEPRDDGSEHACQIAVVDRLYETVNGLLNVALFIPEATLE